MEHEQYEEVYRGHSILLEVQEELPDSWSWHFMIDGRVSLMTGSSLKDSASAARQGISAARARVEELVEDEIRDASAARPQKLP